MTGKLGRRQVVTLLPLATLWWNKPLYLGWDLTTRSLEPALRGPLAYMLGLRYLHTFNNRKEAAAYFQRALQAAPSDSRLHQLAAAQLMRPNGKQ